MNTLARGEVGGLPKFTAGDCRVATTLVSAENRPEYGTQRGMRHAFRLSLHLPNGIPTSFSPRVIHYRRTNEAAVAMKIKE